MILYGDSIGREIYPYLANLEGQNGGNSILLRVLGGTSPCGWIKPAANDAKRWRAAKVIILYVGNAFQDCMLEAAKDPTSERVMRKTVQDSGLIAKNFPESEIYFVGFARDSLQQETADAAGTQSVADLRNSLLQELATSKPNYHYVDGASILYDNGRFTRFLPCQSFDDDYCTNGRVQVRSDDGLHLCPTSAIEVPNAIKKCPTHNSGAIRLARQLMEAMY